MAPIIGCIRAHGGTDSCVLKSRQNHHTTPPPQCRLLFELVARALGRSRGNDTCGWPWDCAGAAKRRRERRMRSWAIHEWLTVAMALAEATHHSAPRRRKTARAEEEMEVETHSSLRAQETPFPGTRPAPVAGPHGAAVTVGYVAAGAPLLMMASLAGDDDVDATTVSFLVAENL